MNVVYIRTTRNSAGQTYYHLVESYRQGGKVRQRVLLSLGRAEEGKLEALAKALGKHVDLISVLELAKSVSVESTFILGPLLVLEAMFEKLGVDAVLHRIESAHKRQEFSLRDVVFAMVAARFVRPTSKLAIFEGMKERLYPGLMPEDIALHHYYRALDLLCEHRDQLERGLFFYERDLLSPEVDVVLYDLTTLRFESTRDDLGSLRKFGFSKEKRSDCTQVVLGLMVDMDGIPLGFEVYPGNTVEGKTLKDIIEKVRQKFRVRRFVFVADRGLLSKENLKVLRAANVEFIVGMRIGGLARKRPELYDRVNFRAIDDGFEVFETHFDDDRGLVTWSQERAERDRKTRDDILLKIRTKLQGRKKPSAKAFVSNTNYRYFLKGLDTGTPTLDEAKVAAAEQKDGFFAIVTNIPDMSAAALVRQYKQLWRIEDTFGEFKGTLRARPIFHWTDDRIIGHLAMCFIALFCEAHLTRALRRHCELRNSRAIREEIIDPRPLTAAAVFQELADVRAVPVKFRDKTIWVRTDMGGHVAQLFRALNLRLPPRVLNHPGVVSQTSIELATC